MSALQEYYFRLSIKMRIALLCFCYSICMIALTVLARSDSWSVRWGALGLFIVLGAFFGMLNILGIGTSIDRVIAYLQTMAGGDLSQNIAAKRNNEISLIIKTIGELQRNMRSMIAAIQATSEGLTRAAGDLRRTSEGMAAGAEQAVGQSASVVHAVEDLTSVSSDIARNCQVMSGKATETKESTREGERTIDAMSRMMAEIGSLVSDTTLAVESLGNNSHQIGEIVGTIEDIADQTNLLALNAAIEAARAGEQGRGFAVVADEVRSLAVRTTTATQEIQKIIAVLQNDVKNVVDSMGQSSRSVKNGEQGVQLSSRAISDIKSHIEVLTDNVAQIATAIEEQSATTASVRNNIRAISDVIDTVSCGTRETDQSASGLASSALELKTMASRFRV
ncbi:methyl-accepting chemotaxis protein [Geobacter sp. FeAm09]|uniref:methyl-accepting chemotaxis protein n=1 Tax=Geobacter sp. FeAm09 TaxID=2597769 RepID=UPI0011EFFB06|nr:methyl-accepting chemotaxis protein [Geobacter sp. FeAm09]QEM68291.1 methyl-accepting chemotaxis protein [Geobacter sp. FeAm09]